MTTLHTTAAKHNVTVDNNIAVNSNSAVSRALLVRKVNRLLAQIGRALNTASLVRSK